MFSTHVDGPSDDFPHNYLRVALPASESEVAGFAADRADDLGLHRGLAVVICKRSNVFDRQVRGIRPLIDMPAGSGAVPMLALTWRAGMSPRGMNIYLARRSRPEMGIMMMLDALTKSRIGNPEGDSRPTP